MRYVVDTGEGQRSFIGVVEALIGLSPGAVEQEAQRTARAVERRRVEIAAEDDGVVGVLDFSR